MYDKHTPGEALSRDLWRMYYDRLNEGLALGYHDKLEQFDPELAEKLRLNIARFSAYKEAGFKRDLTELLGKPREEFLKEAEKVSELYNKAWLDTEYHHTVASANMAARWRKFEERKDLYPNLRYIAVQDDRTRASHASWHNTVLPLDHPWWDTHLPPNDWGCRCGVSQTDEPVSERPEGAVKKAFANNPAKTGKVFANSGYESALGESAKKEAAAFGEAMLKYVLELAKLKAPLITRYTAPNGAKVKVSPFADKRPDELMGNYRTAIPIADDLGRNVSLVAKLDGRLVPGRANLDYLIDGKAADRKTPRGKKIRNIMRSAVGQRAKIIVLDLSENDQSLDAMIKIVERRLLSKGFVGIEEVIIVSHDRSAAVSVKRE